jgi:hypothetical protein
MMDFINWDAATSDGSAVSSDDKSFHNKDSRRPEFAWNWFPFAAHPNESIQGLKLAVEESNLLALVTSCGNLFFKYILG